LVEEVSEDIGRESINDGLATGFDLEAVALIVNFRLFGISAAEFTSTASDFTNSGDERRRNFAIISSR